MAKKKIISDFSALKGKVSFSEKTSDIKVSPKDSHDGLVIESAYGEFAVTVVTIR